MVRIVGGWASGLRIEAPAGTGTRPTQERVREAVFNSLMGVLADARVLDLYAGSAAMGLESVSWGASVCIAVEPSRKAQAVIRANIAHVGMADWVQLWPTTAESALVRLKSSGEKFDVIICDPPWRDGLSQAVRESLPEVLAPMGVVVVEHPAHQEPGALPGLVVSKARSYGDTAVSYWVRP